MKKQEFKLVIELYFEVLATQSNLVAQNISSLLYFLIISLFIKFFNIIEILLISSYQVSELKK